MLTYIIRRLLLMIPTLIGMTFLVFMLIALSPGGIGAGLNVSSGGQMEAGSVAQQRAYIEERYGLDAPAPVQYVRWLARVSPIKFGERDQLQIDQNDSEADAIRHSLPRTVKPARIARWLGVSPSDAAPAAPAPEGDKDALTQQYALASSDYAVARTRLLTARTQAEVALGDILKAQDLGGYVRRDGRTETDRLSSLDPTEIKANADPEAWAHLEELARALGEAHERAVAERARVVAVFRAEPFTPAGVPIVPGYVSLDWPDLGRSFTKKRPVAALIAEALPVTIMLNLVAIPIIYLIAVPGGVLAAVRRGGFFDITSGMLFIALWSIPIPLAGVLLQGIFADRTYMFSWFPVSGLGSLDERTMAFFPGIADGQWVSGWLFDRLWHVVLPVTCLVYAGFAILSKQTRAAMLENFSADYVRTARAKGVSSSKVVTQHVFRNSLLPVITMFVSIFPAMLAGSVVVENIFDIHGMGRMVIESISQRDREVLLANTLIIGLVNMLALLLADILYAAADPRITYD